MADSICTELPPQIVGGVFGLSAEQFCSTLVPFLRADDLLLANARSGLSVLLEELRPPCVWLPSFLCPVLLTVAKSRTAVQWYDVGGNLYPSESNWSDGIADGDLVVVIDHFGFRNSAELFDRLRQRGAIIVEDACQALLTAGTGEGADYVLFSPRKFVGIPDGGVLSSRRLRELPNVTLHNSPRDWWETARDAVTHRAAFDEVGGDRGWFDYFQQSEAEAPIGRFAISELSHNLLSDCFDYTEIAARRRENYATILDRLEEFAVLPLLDSTVVPLGFPVRMRNRDEVRRHLFSHNIFPPVHWAIEGVVPERFAASHRLSAEIMTLPCDQRYDTETMSRMADLVLETGVPCTAI